MDASDVKKVMKLLITLLLLLCHNYCVRSLPVQSQALENVDDQFFWQQAWFSSNDKPDSPFTSGDSKKITAKSIFITPNLVKPSHYCPPGYLIDDNGKCIKVVSISQQSEELLTSRLINLIATHDFDYEYDEEEQTNDDQSNNLPPLVSILNESSEEEGKGPIIVSSSTDNLNFFLGDDKKDPVEVFITTLSNDNETVSYEHTTDMAEDITESNQKAMTNTSEKYIESLLQNNSENISESFTKSSSESSLESASQYYPESFSKSFKENSSESSLKSLQESSTSNSISENHDSSSESLIESSTKNSITILKNAHESSSEESNQSSFDSNSNTNKSSEKIDQNIFESSSTKSNPQSLSQFIKEIIQSTTEESIPSQTSTNLPQKPTKVYSESIEESLESSAMTLEKILYGKFESFLNKSKDKLEIQTEKNKTGKNSEDENKNNSKSSEYTKLIENKNGNLENLKENPEIFKENSESIKENSKELFETSSDDTKVKKTPILSQIINEGLLPSSTFKNTFENSQEKVFNQKPSENPFKSTEPLIITTASSFDVEIYEQSTDVAISESSDTINFDADNAFLLNDSLIIVENKNNSSDFDYSDEITTLEPFSEMEQNEENSSSASRISDVPTTPRNDLDKNTHENNRWNENKFVYHHLTVPPVTKTTTMATPLSTTVFANKLLRFPSDTLNDEEQQRHRVRFPDNDEEIITRARLTPRPTSFSWPRESNTQSNNGVPNKLHITRFWNTQPYISDYSPRGNSKNFRMENFVPYTRKVQVLTPQRYNY